MKVTSKLHVIYLSECVFFAWIIFGPKNSTSFIY